MFRALAKQPARLPGRVGRGAWTRHTANVITAAKWRSQRASGVTGRPRHPRARRALMPAMTVVRQLSPSVAEPSVGKRAEPPFGAVEPGGAVAPSLTPSWGI